MQSRGARVEGIRGQAVAKEICTCPHNAINSPLFSAGGLVWVEEAMAITNIPASSQLTPHILLLFSLLFIGDCTQLKSGHAQFLKANYGNGGRYVGCARNASVCSDPVKNPNGGFTCCFNIFCKDLKSDPLNCGQCGSPCPFGLDCCAGFCVDTRNDPMHCGNCFYQCPKNEKCMLGLCGY